MEEKNNTLHNMEMGKEFLEQVQKENSTNEYWQQFFKTGKIQDYLNAKRADHTLNAQSKQAVLGNVKIPNCCI